MNLDLKEIFRNTLDPNEGIRKRSEEKLNTLQKDPNALLQLPHTLMKDSDPIIKNTSSLFFKNAIINEWNNENFQQTKYHIVNNLPNYYAEADGVNIVAFNSILIHFYNFEQMAIIEAFIKKIIENFTTANKKQVEIILNILEHIFTAERIKYNLESIIVLLFDNQGQTLLSKLHEFITQGDYKTAKIIMKILAKCYNYYSIPQFLCRIEIFSYVINIAIEILKIQNSNDIFFMKTKKWASFFLNKASNKGVKKFFKKTELSDYITHQSRFTYIYDVMLKQLTMGEVDQTNDEPIKLNSIEFLTTCASSKASYPYLEKDLGYLITGFILPLHELSEEEQDNFDHNPEKYLRDKYHYFNYSLRNDSGTLFIEIVKNLKHNNDAMDWLFSFFIQIFESYKNNPTKENLKKKYAALFLMCNVIHTIFKYDKNKFECILNTYIFPDIQSTIPILKSQTCYFLSFVEEEVSNNVNLHDSLDSTIMAMRLNNDALKVDATLAMNFFVSNPSVSERFRTYIPEVIQSILSLSSSHDIEPLTFLLDTIMQNYPEDISRFAPGLVNSLGSLILSHLQSNESEGDDRLMVISGFLRSVESIVMSIEDSGPLVVDVYNNFYDFIYYIFSEKKVDFFQEALDLTNGFLFSIKRVEKSMWNLFMMILTLPKDEIAVYPNEISDIIDNFVSFGGEVVLEPSIIQNIYEIIKLYCLADDDNFYDEDFICGCKIIETVLLNVGDKLLALDPQGIDFFINIVVENTSRLDEDTSSMVYALEVIMHRFYLKTLETINYLNSKQFMKKFFATTFAKRKDFIRVHDKKICIRFLGTLLSLDQSFIHNQLDVKELNGFFTSIICTLPSAIETRNRLKKEEEDSEDYDDDASDQYNELEEDIYHTTILENFDPFDYILKFCTSPTHSSVAALSLSNMTNDQLTRINEVFNSQVKQPK